MTETFKHHCEYCATCDQADLVYTDLTEDGFQDLCGDGLKLFCVEHDWDLERTLAEIRPKGKEETMNPHIKYLCKLGACQDAVVYAQQFRTLQAAWNKCPDPRWMMWLLYVMADRRDIKLPAHMSHTDLRRGCPGCKFERRFKTDGRQCDYIREVCPKVSLPPKPGPKGKKK